MPVIERIVVDTNVLVSRLILPQSVPAEAVRRVTTESLLLFCDETMNELASVLSHPKFDRYVSLADRKRFIRDLCDLAEFIPIIQIVRECRDPKDDKFLEVALNGRADLIITGDNDLLALNPWRGTTILNPAEYLTSKFGT